MTCCFRNSSRHAIQIGISKQKILFYLFVLCNAVFDGFFKLFFVLYNFDEVYSTFLQVLTATSCSFIISFCNPRAGYKSPFFCVLFTTQKIHHHHHHHDHHHCSTSYIVGFLYRCIYPLQHIPEDDNFYLVCRQN